jgi:CRP-like cAMP-binding protein
VALDDDIALFTGHPLLRVMERDALRLVAFSADRRSFKAGDILARKGEIAEAAFLVASGALALDEHGDGRPAGVVARQGSLVGEMAMFAATERPATIMAREPSAVLVIRREAVTRVLDEFPASAIAVHAVLKEQLREFSNRLRPVRKSLDSISD